MIFSEDQTEILISPFNVSNSAFYHISIQLSLSAIKEDQIVGETTINLRVTIYKPRNVYNKKTNQTAGNFSEFPLENSTSNNFTNQLKKGVLEP